MRGGRRRGDGGATEAAGVIDIAVGVEERRTGAWPAG